MYNITFYRFDTNYRSSIQKGLFKKQFSTLSDIAKFYVEGRHRMSMPRLSYELDKRELHILSSKINSLLCKIYKTV